MIRTTIASAVAFFVFVGAASAAEVRGRLVKVDAEKNTITLNVAKRGEAASEKTFKIAKDAKFVTLKPGATRTDKPTEETLKDGLKAEVFTKPVTGGRGGATITITTAGEGDKEEVTAIKVSTGMRRRPPQ